MTAGALVVAAGFSRRFGSDKRLYTLRSGRSMLQASLAPYLDAFRNVAVVVRATDSRVAKHLLADAGPRRPIIVTTTHAERGMSASLADGVRSLADWDYVFIGLGDMPFLRAETLRALDERMREARRDRLPRIVLPTYEGRTGHPVGFSREYFAELIALEGDQGAKRVIAAHREAVSSIDVDDPGVVEDLDQPPV